MKDNLKEILSKMQEDWIEGQTSSLFGTCTTNVSPTADEIIANIMKLAFPLMDMKMDVEFDPYHEYVEVSEVKWIRPKPRSKKKRIQKKALKLYTKTVKSMKKVKRKDKFFYSMMHYGLKTVKPEHNIFTVCVS